jgi:methylmalonyl-CoA mutase cobalamin-binding subunit
VDALRAADAGDIAVVVGGTIPQGDAEGARRRAVAVFPTGPRSTSGDRGPQITDAAL